MSLLLGNLRDLIGDLWDGSDLPDPEPDECPDGDD